MPQPRRKDPGARSRYGPFPAQPFNISCPWIREQSSRVAGFLLVNADHETNRVLSPSVYRRFRRAVECFGRILAPHPELGWGNF